MNTKKEQRSAFDEALSHPLLPSTSNKTQLTNHKSNYGYLPFQKTNNKDKESLANRSTFIDESKNPFATEENFQSKYGIGLEFEQVQTPQLKRIDFDSALVLERNLEITTINQSMRQIHDIQQDLAALVDHQQEDIDDIESNAIETHAKADSALNDLEKAAIFSKSNERISKNCVLFAILCMCILLFGLKLLIP